MKLSVILPTYNEKENIVPLIQEIKAVLDTERQEYEILIVDDNSPDGTAEEVKSSYKDGKNVFCIVRHNAKGLASAIKEGILQSRGEYILLMDTDFSHSPETIPELLKESEDNDAVVASRYVKGGGMEAPWHKYLGSLIMNRAIDIILELNIMDSTGGFLIFKKELLGGLDMNKIFIGYGEFCFRLLYALKIRGKKIKEIPFRYGIRRYGETKSRLINMGFSYLAEALKTRFQS